MTTLRMVAALAKAGLVLAAVALTLSTAINGAASASKTWQVTATLHCNNVTLCLAAPEQRLGGDGGPVSFFADATAVAEFTTFQHFFASGPAAGAVHISFQMSARSRSINQEDMSC